MAETFTDEGLQAILNFIPRNTGASLPSTLYMAAITTGGSPALTASTVPARTVVWATQYSTVAGEPAIGTGAYARVSMANTVWGAPSNQANGWRSTGTQQSFPQSTAAWSNPTVVGYAMVTASTAGAGIAYYYCNFDDTTSVAINASGIVLQVTPYWEFDL